MFTHCLDYSHAITFFLVGIKIYFKMGCGEGTELLWLTVPSKKLCLGQGPIPGYTAWPHIKSKQTKPNQTGNDMHVK